LEARISNDSVMKVSKIRATGGCIIAKDTHRLLLQQRTIEGSFPRNWAFFGGKVEENENIAQALLRELSEEIDLNIKDDVVKIYPLDQYHTRNSEFSYYSFVVLVENEFIPTLNYESGGYAWVEADYIPKPLHPGTRRTLFRKKKLKIIKDIISSL
jgi:8-oxo-dGTP pyrophosphatase MutT (NUDIX family)